MSKPSVHNIDFTAKRVKYLLGYVIGVDWSDGSEWLYHKAGLTRAFGQGKESDPTYYPTREKAIQFARQNIVSSNPIFTRAYTYETHIPEHAKGLTPMSEVQDSEKKFI